MDDLMSGLKFPELSLPLNENSYLMIFSKGWFQTQFSLPKHKMLSDYTALQRQNTITHKRVKLSKMKIIYIKNPYFPLFCTLLLHFLQNVRSHTRQKAVSSMSSIFDS